MTQLAAWKRFYLGSMRFQRCCKHKYSIKCVPLITHVSLIQLYKSVNIFGWLSLSVFGCFNFQKEFCSLEKVELHFKGGGSSVKNCWAGRGGYAMRLHVLEESVNLLGRTIINKKYVLQLVTEHWNPWTTGQLVRDFLILVGWNLISCCTPLGLDLVASSCCGKNVFVWDFGFLSYRNFVLLSTFSTLFFSQL